MKIKKLIASVICIVLVSVFIVGCGSASYDIIEENGAMYLELHNVKSSSQGDVATGLLFESVAELQERVMSSDLSEQELGHIKSFFSKSKDGKIIVPNMNVLQEPSIPQGLFVKERVEWRGQSFDVSLDADKTFSDSFYGFFTYGTKTVYNNYKESAIATDGHFIHSVENMEERNAKATIFSTGISKLKHVEYTIKDGDTTLDVVECYRLQTANGYECSDTIPYRVYIFGVTGVHYYYFSLSDLGFRPSVEWLSSFGVKDVTASD